MTLAAMWMDLENIMLGKVRVRQLLNDSPHICNLKNKIIERIYKTEADSQTEKTNLWFYHRGWG